MTTADVPCDVDVVAIGASAGGVAALPAVLSVLPRGFFAAVIVVLHLDAHVRSYLASVLGRACRLPVREATSGEPLQPGIVYVAPPGAHLVVRGRVLMLTDAAPVHFVRPSVDVLFASVAAACGPRAVGVVLTGTGVDGAAGVRAIKGHGGRTIAQDPVTAQHRGMPAAACATGCVDVTLPLGDIGAALADLTPASHATGPTDALDG
jgi:two-component system chemotaxis response regulator CheB